MLNGDSSKPVNAEDQKFRIRRRKSSTMLPLKTVTLTMTAMKSTAKSLKVSGKINKERKEKAPYVIGVKMS